MKQLWPVLGLAAALLGSGVAAGDEPDIEGFKQILPRGRIAAIDEPQFVPAAEAKIAPDAWVLGVVVEGEALAFSLGLLNSHEVVNGREGETPYAAVW